MKLILKEIKVKAKFFSRSGGCCRGCLTAAAATAAAITAQANWLVVDINGFNVWGLRAREVDAKVYFEG